MNFNIGLIIAAGKQTRFKENIPKSLVNINGGCLLDINFNILSKYCKKVFVVCSNENEKFFDKKYNKIIINSGLGSGDAVYKALLNLDTFLSSIKSSNIKIFICWGDVLLNDDLCSYLDFIGSFSDKKDKCIVPCIYEKNPYVQLLKISKNKMKVLYSKYGDKISDGYHDMSLFLFPLDSLKSSLTFFIKKFYDSKNNVYNTKHNNEFEFLDIFNETDLDTYLLDIPEQYKTYSFNTVQELNLIKKEICSED